MRQFFYNLTWAMARGLSYVCRDMPSEIAHAFWHNYLFEAYRAMRTESPVLIEDDDPVEVVEKEEKAPERQSLSILMDEYEQSKQRMEWEGLFDRVDRCHETKSWLFFKDGYGVRFCDETIQDMHPREILFMLTSKRIDDAVNGILPQRKDPSAERVWHNSGYVGSDGKPISRHVGYLGGIMPAATGLRPTPLNERSTQGVIRGG